MKTKLTVMFALAVGVLLSGCSSTGKRAGMTTLGTALGAGAGYVATGKKAAGAAGGAIVGAGITALAQGRDEGAYQEGVDDGYQLGSADATKRLYFAKQALEKRDGQSGERTSYYVFQGPTETADGQKLVPNTVVVPVVEQSAAVPATKKQ